MNKWTDKLKVFLGRTPALSSEFFEDLSDLLVEGDFGAALAMRAVDELEKRCKKGKITSTYEAKDVLAAILDEYLAVAADIPALEPLDINALNVVLLLGVNGVGKTTSAAKLAFRYQQEGKPLLAAADTFRAAAIEQLQIHGERLGIRVVAHKQHADAAAVVHDALLAALHGGYNPVIADTAGRMHTKTALVEELSKISRVIERFVSKNPDNTVIYRKYLVLDATTGSNALIQAETFNSAVQLDGVILTKFDSSARGGIVFPLAVNYKLPVVFVCDGEQYPNIKPFDAGSYINIFLN